jgi:hypothetical protein
MFSLSENRQTDKQNILRAAPDKERTSAVLHLDRDNDKITIKVWNRAMPKRHCKE